MDARHRSTRREVRMPNILSETGSYPGRREPFRASRSLAQGVAMPKAETVPPHLWGGRRPLTGDKQRPNTENEPTHPPSSLLVLFHHLLTQ